MLLPLAVSGIPTHCDSCGLDFHSGAINTFGSQVTLKNVSTNCPRCGNFASMQDGVYGLVGRVLEITRTPGIQRENLEAFQTLAEAARAGKINREDAVNQAAQISMVFGNLLEWANKNGVALGVLIGILTLVISLYMAISADEGSTQAHADAQSILQSQQKLYAAYQARESPCASPVGRLAPKAGMIAPSPKQTPTQVTHSPNRHERRKAAKLSNPRH